LDRRRAIAGLAGLSLPLWSRAAETHRVGYLSGSSKSDTAASFEALRQGLKEFGYQEGQNVVLDAHWADYSSERAAQLASEIASRRPAVIVTQGLAHGPVSRLSPSVPMVFLHSGDPVSAGLAASLARPGRNATGISLMALEMIGKRMDLLKQIQPKMRRVAFLANPEHPGEHRELAASRAAAKQISAEVMYFQARNPAELDTALPAIAAAKPDAAVIFSDGLMLGQREMLAAFFLKQRIPSACGWAPFVTAGHLLSYGPDVNAAWRRVAYFVDRFIKGAKPAELPIELASNIEMALNRRTASAMNVVFPSALLLRADRVVD